MFLILCLQLVELPQETLSSQEFKETCGTVLEELKSKDEFPYGCRAYYPVYMFRRIVFAAFIVFLDPYPYVECVMLIVFTIIPVYSLRPNCSSSATS